MGQVLEIVTQKTSSDVASEAFNCSPLICLMSRRNDEEGVKSVYEAANADLALHALVGDMDERGFGVNCGDFASNSCQESNTSYVSKTSP